MTTEPTPITPETLELAQLAKAQGHKYDHGHLLVLSGGPGRTGAARLAARAALRMGAGAVTLGVPPAAQLEVAMQVTAVMLRRVADAAALTEVLEDGRLNALCLGPGLGLGEGQGALLGAALAARRATVLDADALTLLGQEEALFVGLHRNCVLTPHGGEFARLFPDLSEVLKAGDMGPAEAVRQGAARAGCTVLLKGPETHIGCPTGAVLVHQATGDRAAPWLATAGAGDVLSGLIAGLLARGFAPLRAAALGTYLHVECALDFGPGLTAEDLSERLPGVLARLQAA